MRIGLSRLCGVLLVLCACTSGTDVGGKTPSAPELEPNFERPPPPNPPLALEPELNPPPMRPPEPVREIPTDERVVISASTTPPPISGGTLLASADQRYAVMSDPDRDRVSIVDLQARALVANVALQTGDEPGRLVEDDRGRVHVVLRRSGQLAAIDLATHSVLGRRALCAAPRGIDFNSAARELVVSCASGELMRLPVDGGDAVQTVQLGADLRDVQVRGQDVLVSRFRSAQIMTVNAEGQVVNSGRPAAVTALFAEHTGRLIVDDMSPELAWRMQPMSDGQTLVLHQLARNGAIDLEVASGDQSVMMPTSSSYTGGTGDCRGVVQTALSVVDASGTAVRTVRVGSSLVVDVAVAADGAIALAQAGSIETAQPVPMLKDDSASLPVRADPREDLSSPVLLLDAGLEAQMNFGFESPGETGCLGSGAQLPIEGQATAVAFAQGDALLLTQTREPATLWLLERNTRAMISIDLQGESVEDTGHSMFHRNAGSGVACASCHPEGGDDGHTWRFVGMGPRRTLSLHVGLEGSAPFHWAGDEQNFTALIDDVMVGRMGGVHQSPQRIAALEQWLYVLQAPAPQRAATDPAALRGKALFEGVAECASCHNGSRFSSGQTRDVGTGEALQVPSLIGVAYRTPLMHDGCASDLRGRFAQGCGGALHGKTAGLMPAEIDDLIAYLETL